jgi:hypothetical protein
MMLLLLIPAGLLCLSFANHAALLAFRLLAVMAGTLVVTMLYQIGEAILLTINPALSPIRVALVLGIVVGLTASLVCDALARSSSKQALSLPALIAKESLRTLTSTVVLASLALGTLRSCGMPLAASSLLVLASNCLLETLLPSVGLATSRLLSHLGHRLNSILH